MAFYFAGAEESLVPVGETDRDSWEEKRRREERSKIGGLFD